VKREEFAIWENLSDYPPNLNDEKNKVIDFTCLVPGMIGFLIIWQKKYKAYVDSLKEKKKKPFCNILYELFLGRETPATTLFDSAYRDRARDVFLNFFEVLFYGRSYY